MAPGVIIAADTIEGLAIAPRLVRESLVGILREAAAGSASGGLKTQVAAIGGAYFQALPAISEAHRLACLKWVSVVKPAPGRPAISATILLTDIDTGATVAALDGGWITRARTGAMTAIAAEVLAPASSEQLGLVGAGAQARSQLEALREVRPGLRHLTVYDRHPETAEAFLAWARSLGLKGKIAAEPAEAVRDQDIVVSSVPAAGMDEPFLDAAWLKPDSFVSMVDIGRSWRPQSFEQFSIVATDDIAQSQALAAGGKLGFKGEFDLTLQDIAIGEPPKRHGRNAFVFGGIGLADLATAALVWRTLEGSAGRAAARAGVVG